MSLLFSTPLYIVQKLAQDNICKLGKKYVYGKLLDIGCGKKPYKNFLNYEGYIGLDTNYGLKPDVGGTVLNLPFRRDCFDSVLCTAVLEHLAEPEEGIKEIHRVLKINGVAYISVPMTWYLHYEPNDYFRFTKYGLIYLLKKNGFKIIEIDKIGGLFSYVGARISEILFNIFMKIFFFVSLKYRTFCCISLTIPVSLIFYFLSLNFDKINKKDVFAWGCVVKKT